MIGFAFMIGQKQTIRFENLYRKRLIKKYAKKNCRIHGGSFLANKMHSYYAGSDFTKTPALVKVASQAIPFLVK